MEVKFPTIEGSYGGNQAWFSKSLWAAGGCGVIASANLYSYFSDRQNMSKDEYMQVATALYYWLSPLHFYNPSTTENTYGMISFTHWYRRTLEFLDLRGVHLQGRRKLFMRKRALVEIRKALHRGELPVLAVLGVPGVSPYGNHYMVVSGIKGDVLIFSTWGQRREVKFSELCLPGIFFHLAAFKRKN